MRSQKEIEDKIKELYDLAREDKIDILRVIVLTDALCWVLGDGYLDTNVILGGEEDEKESDI